MNENEERKKDGCQTNTCTGEQKHNNTVKIVVFSLSFADVVELLNPPLLAHAFLFLTSLTSNFKLFTHSGYIV